MFLTTVAYWVVFDYKEEQCTGHTFPCRQKHFSGYAAGIERFSFFSFYFGNSSSLYLRQVVPLRDRTTTPLPFPSPCSPEHIHQCCIYHGWKGMNPWQLLGALYIHIISCLSVLVNNHLPDKI